MSAVETAWPRKTRELHNHHMDSTIWEDFNFREDDIVVGTYAKSGTTWTQQIVGQLVFRGEPHVPIAELSPWLDLRVPPREVKLPALVTEPKVWFALSVSVSTSGLVRAAFATVAVSV